MTLLLLLSCGPVPSDTASRPALPADSSDAVSETCFDDAPFLEIGTGSSTWEPLEALDPVTMVHGPQGGWHILGGAAVHHTNAIVRIDFTITDAASGVVVSAVSYSIQLLREPDSCTGHVANLYGYLDVSGLDDGTGQTPHELLDGSTLLMEMAATDSAGRIARGSLQVVAVPDPEDE